MLVNVTGYVTQQCQDEAVVTDTGTRHAINDGNTLGCPAELAQRLHYDTSSLAGAIPARTTMFTDSQNKMLLDINAAIQKQRGFVSPEEADAVMQMAAVISYMAYSDYRVPGPSVALEVANEMILVSRQAMDQKMADLASRGVILK